MRYESTQKDSASLVPSPILRAVFSTIHSQNGKFSE